MESLRIWKEDLCSVPAQFFIVLFKPWHSYQKILSPITFDFSPSRLRKDIIKDEPHTLFLRVERVVGRDKNMKLDYRLLTKLTDVLFAYFIGVQH